MLRIDREEVLMEAAWLFSRRGTCDRLHVGAVVAREGRILVTGYNGPPAGLPHCNHMDQAQGVTPDAACIRAVHAEANVIAFAARHGVRIECADLYCTHMPCVVCAPLIINSGISRVYYDRKMTSGRGSGANLFEEAGLKVIRL